MIRGELWWVDLGIPYGSEPGFRRPALIIQNDFFNNSKLNTTVVIPLTTNTLYAEAPENILLYKDETPLDKDSVIVISQIRVIDKNRLIEKISKLGRDKIDEVEAKLMLVLGIIGIYTHGRR
ncbi:MAG: type II toxin-antitoxin system PemK/MazF family toxin [Treponema sp.]|nr:type II toxin-antitoxin system PemK/MazF family toxin [Treponema sp.]